MRPFFIDTFSVVMLGPVPSICYVAIGDTLADPRYKTEDDGAFEERSVAYPITSAAIYV
ncbi:hypothetical protein AGR7A_Cc200036 [Agrobacterium deltaense NCPPB 1641]|uniref:Uncharacterized protein n=1 Tax=Agrobacterium deltaense NCPPB 1641 TaxID=1183425 RepID=A0A1S7TLH0_9HYPH|nr:hypothetical protein AGR7A_Cc200036 [Agrobacterium deltaense NCPPB 1641]